MSGIKVSRQTRWPYMCRLRSCDQVTQLLVQTQNLANQSGLLEPRSSETHESGHCDEAQNGPFPHTLGGAGVAQDAATKGLVPAESVLTQAAEELLTLLAPDALLALIGTNDEAAAAMTSVKLVAEAVCAIDTAVRTTQPAARRLAVNTRPKHSILWIFVAAAGATQDLIALEAQTVSVHRAACALTAGTHAIEPLQKGQEADSEHVVPSDVAADMTPIEGHGQTRDTAQHVSGFALVEREQTNHQLITRRIMTWLFRAGAMCTLGKLSEQPVRGAPWGAAAKGWNAAQRNETQLAWQGR